MSGGRMVRMTYRLRVWLRDPARGWLTIALPKIICIGLYSFRKLVVFILNKQLLLVLEQETANEVMTGEKRAE